MISTEVTLNGPFFTGALPPKVGRRLDDALQELVEKGETRLGQLLQKGAGGVYLADGRSTGYYRQNVAGELRPDHSALITDGGVVYGPWLEGVGSRNTTTRFKGYHTFRQVGDWLQEQAPAVLEKHAKKLVGELD